MSRTCRPVDPFGGGPPRPAAAVPSCAARAPRPSRPLPLLPCAAPAAPAAPAAEDGAHELASRLVLGCLVTALRERARMSSSMVAHAAGLRPNLVFLIERGRVEAVGDETRQKLGRALLVDLVGLHRAAWERATAAVALLGLPARWWGAGPALVQSLARLVATAAVEALSAPAAAPVGASDGIGPAAGAAPLGAGDGIGAAPRGAPAAAPVGASDGIGPAAGAAPLGAGDGIGPPAGAAPRGAPAAAPVGASDGIGPAAGAAVVGVGDEIGPPQGCPPPPETDGGHTP